MARAYLPLDPATGHATENDNEDHRPPSRHPCRRRRHRRPIIRSSDNLDGWQIGGGLEYAISEKVSARLEYRYSDFGRDGGDYEGHQTLFGVSYNF